MWFARVRYVSTAKYVSTAVQTAGTEKDFVVWGIDRMCPAGIGDLFTCPRDLVWEFY
jgi:hypothetical protein